MGHAMGLGLDGEQAVREYVAAGGGYIGFCAGAVVASVRSTIPYETIGLFPGYTPQFGLSEDLLYDVRIDHPILAGSGHPAQAYYHSYGGPRETAPDPGFEATALASRANDGCVGFVAGLYGDGRYFISIAHPEDDPSTYPIIDAGMEYILRLSDPPSNQPPQAVIDGDATVPFGEDASFSAVGSADPEGYPISYAWDFGDGGTAHNTATPAHAFASPGTYLVRVTVADGMGGMDTAEMEVTALGFPQAAIALDPPSGDLPLAVRIADASAGVVVEREWDLGDGNPASDEILDRTFTTPGRHLIRLTVTGPFEGDPRNVSEATAEVVIGVFRRGDVQGDDAVDIGDVVVTLDYLFWEGHIDCPDAADMDDDGDVDLADPIRLLTILFVEPTIPPPPALEIGPDPTPDALACPR
ncbi:MAG: PKD domain-containing protein [Planctomycetes bacterium]|nr:PKD domain-containing protein [Planctomycetota bacterium]